MTSSKKRKMVDGERVVRVYCKFYRVGECDFPDGAPCPHAVPHEVVIPPDSGPTDSCSGECQKRHIKTWCTR